MKSLKLIFLILSLVLLIKFVNASDVSLKVTPIQDTILPGQPAVFDIEVTNNGPKGEIKSIVTDFSWRKESNYGFYTIDGGKTLQDTLKFYPIGSLVPGRYSVNVRIYPTNTPENYVDQAFLITIVSYKDIIDAKLDFNPQGLSPNKENLVTLKLKNRYPIEVKDLNVKLRSEFINQDFVTNIGKEESKDFPFSVLLENTKEGDYEINIFGLFNNNIVANKTDVVKVASFSNVKETKKEEFSFLVKTSEFSRINDGNTVSKEIYTITLSSFENLFTKFSPEPTIIEKLGGSYRYVWQFTLNPKDSYFILSKTNYGKPILVLILLTLLVYFIYKRANAGLIMTKRVLLLKSKEGNIAGLKVLLILRNSGQNLKNIRITDSIPGLLELPHEYGTLKPNSTRSGVAGSLVIWEISELLKGEERVISYKMKSKVNSLGKITIPRAICRYKDKMGKLYIVKSNHFNLF